MRTSQLFRIAVLGFLVGAVGACTSPSEESRPADADTSSEQRDTDRVAEASNLLVQQRNRWQASSVSNYRYTLLRRVAQSPSSESPIIVTVRNDTVASAQYKSAPEIANVDPKKKQQLPTIDSLFAFIEHSAEQGVDSLRARYDAEAGYPYAVFVDRDAKKTGDEIEIEVNDLVVLTPKKQ